jgi:hypothetical protein
LKVQDVNARLWQDPFTAAAKAGARRQLLECSELASNPHCNDIKVQLGLKVLGLQKDSSDVEIIAATVSAAPYPEEEENRRRMRYALVSGLDAMDYVPQDPEHIGYVVNCVQSIAGKVPAGTSCDRLSEESLPSVIPFEWFRGKFNPFKKILVLWYDEDVLGENPLAKFSKLATSIGGDAPPRMHVIGPSWSDTLRAILREACGIQQPTQPGVVGSCSSEAKESKKWEHLAATKFYARPWWSSWRCASRSLLAVQSGLTSSPIKRERRRKDICLTR